MASPPPSPPLSMTHWEYTLGMWMEAFNDVNLQSVIPFTRSSVDHSVRWWTYDAPLQSLNTRGMWLMLREGMELLELFTRAHPHAVKKFLKGYEAHPDAQEESVSGLPRYQITLSEDSDVLEALAPERLVQLFTQYGSQDSDEFESVKASLLADLAGRREGREFDREVDGRVEVAIEMTLELEEETLPDVFAAIRRLADAHTRNESRGPQERSPFTLHSLQIRLPSVGRGLIPDNALELFNDLAASGVRISHFHFMSLFEDVHGPALLTRFLVNQLMPVGDCGVQSLDFNACWFDVPVVHSLCTAIARSTSLRRINFEIGDDDFMADGEEEFNPQEAEWWPWLAYALFSTSTDHGIEKVTLNLSSLTMDHVQAIRSVLNHGNPLALLYDSPGSTLRSAAPVDNQDQILMATFVATPTIYIGRYQEIIAPGSDQLRLQFHAPIVPCQIVRDRPGDDFIEFFMPGRRVCWADRSQVTEIKPMVKRDKHPVRELMISTNRRRGRDAQPVVELLRMIGGPLEKLRIYHNPSLVDINLCNAILPACSNLTYLEVNHMQVRSLNWLINAPRACKLKTLQLSVREGISKLSLVAFFQALGDKENPLTRSLRELKISFSQFDRNSERAQVEEARTCKMFIAMLDTNRLLERCELQTRSRAIADKYSTQFMAHNDEPLNVVEHPLSVSRKLAFLSVMSLRLPSSPHKQARITHGSVGTTERTAIQLTPEAVRLVFELAAIPKRRKCKIT